MTPPAHRIRLAGFWEAIPLPDGQVRHSRRFGRPRTSDPMETVWVAGDPSLGPIDVTVNGEPVGRAEAGRSFAFEVTTRLAPRNVLAIVTGAGAPLGEVYVEIRGPG